MTPEEWIEHRDEVLEGLCKLHDWLLDQEDALGEIDVSVQIPPVCETRQSLEVRARSFPQPRKVDMGDNSTLIQVKHYFSPTVSIWSCVFKEGVCRRVRKGTKHVQAQPATEAHDEPIYEWKCEPLEILDRG